MSQFATLVGTAHSRVDGILKVTGQARYAGEFSTPDLAYGYVVSSAIAKGRITGIDIWSTKDQSGNAREVTLRNAALEGVADRIQIDSSHDDSPFLRRRDVRFLVCVAFWSRFKFVPALLGAEVIDMASIRSSLGDRCLHVHATNGSITRSGTGGLTPVPGAGSGTAAA